MSETVYTIAMDTQLGRRHGTIELQTNNSKIAGTLSILGHVEPIHGELSDTGGCTLYGRIVTLMRTMDYTAIGYLDAEKIDLVLQGNWGKFHISGLASAAGKGNVGNGKNVSSNS